MTPYLSGLLAEMNGADLVACGILGLIALGVALRALVTWVPVAWNWALSALARWHARQALKANTPKPFPPDVSPLPWAPLVVTLGLVAFLGFALYRCGGVG